MCRWLVLQPLQVHAALWLLELQQLSPFPLRVLLKCAWRHELWPSSPRPSSPSHAAGILQNIDQAGVSVTEALEQAGFDPSPASLRKMIIPKDQVRVRKTFLSEG